jgi:hypothetical protein
MKGNNLPKAFGKEKDEVLLKATIVGWQLGPMEEGSQGNLAISASL